jgi:hypothetical protein
MLLIMFFVPLFDATTYVEDNQDVDFFVKNIHYML